MSKFAETPRFSAQLTGKLISSRQSLLLVSASRKGRIPEVPLDVKIIEIGQRTLSLIAKVASGISIEIERVSCCLLSLPLAP